MIEAGLDPRRFAQDLLERFRDLLVLDAVPDAADSGLLDAPADQLERMRGQAARYGRPSLSRAADVMATALVEMRGTTSPRLVLELACARVLLPGRRRATPPRCWPGSTGWNAARPRPASPDRPTADAQPAASPHRPAGARSRRRRAAGRAAAADAEAAGP